VRKSKQHNKRLNTCRGSRSSRRPTPAAAPPAPAVYTPKHPVSSPQASVNKAIIKKQYDLAISQLDEAIGLAPNAVALWSNRAYVRELRSEPELALRDAEQCIALAPDFPKGHLRLARALMGLGRYAEARARPRGSAAAPPARRR